MSDQQDSPPAVESSGAAIAAANSKPTEALPTKRASFDTQLNLLRAYAAAASTPGEPVTNEAVAKLAGVTASTVSLNNSFFNSIGLLSKVDREYAPSADVIAFHRACEWDEDTAAHKLADPLRESWFGRALLPHLSMGPLPEADAVARVAEACAAGKKYEAEVRLLIDYLEAAGIIARDANGTVSRRAVAKSPHPAPAEPVSPAARTPSENGRISTEFSTPGTGAVNFHIDVSVDLDDLKGWKADRLNAFFGGLAQVLAAKADVEAREAGTK